jgi:hypothetical protein
MRILTIVVSQYKKRKPPEQPNNLGPFQSVLHDLLT